MIATQHLQATTLVELDRAGVPRILIDATEQALDALGGGWTRRADRRLVAGFRLACAVTDEAADRLIRWGCDPRRVRVTGRLRPLMPPPAPDPRALDALTRQIGTRPTWFVDPLDGAEAAAVLAAHDAALRRSHRLLLAARPGAGLDAPLHGAPSRAAGHPVADDHPVVIADAPGDAALFRRLAPVTFLGGTFGDGARVDPLHVAALGSVVLHGPRLGQHAASFRRLAVGGASRQVTHPDALGSALMALLAPDRAAELALAGWRVVSDGAGHVDALVDALAAALDGDAA